MAFGLGKIYKVLHHDPFRCLIIENIAKQPSRPTYVCLFLFVCFAKVEYDM